MATSAESHNDVIAETTATKGLYDMLRQYAEDHKMGMSETCRYLMARHFKREAAYGDTPA